MTFYFWGCAYLCKLVKLGHFKTVSLSDVLMPCLPVSLVLCDLLMWMTIIMFILMICLFVLCHL